MNRSLFINVIFVFCINFSHFVYATDKNDQSLVEDPTSKMDTVIPNSIDRIVRDFFLGNEPDDPRISSSATLPENEAQQSYFNKSLDPLQRKLEFGLVEKARAAQFIILDKIYGVSEQVTVRRAQQHSFNSITIMLQDCFYQKDNRDGDALALVRVVDESQTRLPFYEWFSSTQSHLTNYSNYRYSTWLLRCIISDQE